VRRQSPLLCSLSLSLSLLNWRYLILIVTTAPGDNECRSLSSTSPLLPLSSLLRTVPCAVRPYREHRELISGQISCRSDCRATPPTHPLQRSDLPSLSSKPPDHIASCGLPPCVSRQTNHAWVNMNPSLSLSLSLSLLLPSVRFESLRDRFETGADAENSSAFLTRLSRAHARERDK